MNKIIGMYGLVAAIFTALVLAPTVTLVYADTFCSPGSIACGEIHYHGGSHSHSDNQFGNGGDENNGPGDGGSGDSSYGN